MKKPAPQPITARSPRISLEQWQAFVAVVEWGSYAAAAAGLHKTQSAITYLVKKLEEQLGVHVFEIRGRKASLTPVGDMLLERARVLLRDAGLIEQSARASSAGWEPEIRLAVEILFPQAHLIQALSDFAAASPDTRIEVYETVLSGTAEALLKREVDLAITPQIPTGFLGDPILKLRLRAVAHPDHPLHRLGRPLTQEDLRPHRHLLVRDSGLNRDRHASSAETQQRWVFGSFSASIEAARAGAGFAWYPESLIATDLQSGQLAALPLTAGGQQDVELYLIVADAVSAGPGVQRLAQALRKTGMPVGTPASAIGL